MLSFFHTAWLGIWAENSVPGKVIILLIVFLAVRAWIQGRRHLGRYHREGLQLSYVMTRLEHLRQPAAKTAESPSADGENEKKEEDGEKKDGEDARWKSLARPGQVGAVEVATLREGVDPKSLIGERLVAIEKMRGHQVKVNLRTLQQLTSAREAASKGLTAPSFTAGIAMMLGILGTFLGLSMMVQQIQFSLPSDSGGVTLESWTDAFANISTVLAGIKTAFSTSLVGMVSAIWLSLLAARLSRVQAALLEQLERFTTEDLLPATAPTAEDESLLERISLQLENSFLHLGEVSQDNRDVLRNLTGAQAAFADIVEEIRLITKNEASRDLERVVAELVKTNAAVLSVVEKLPGIAHAVEAGQERFLQRMSPWRQTAAGLGQLWSSRLFGAVPGSLVMLILLLVFLLGITRLVLDFT